MLGTVWEEIRVQPGRFLATIAAIVVCVGFLAASQVFSATEGAALAKRSVLYSSRADVVVTSHRWHWSHAKQLRDEAIAVAEQALQADPDVEAVERFSQVYVQLSNGTSFAGVMLTSAPQHPELRWFEPSQGRYPSGPDEIMLTEEIAASLGVPVGSEVRLNLPHARPLTVVGLVAERGFATPSAYVPFEVILEADAQFPPADYRVIVNPGSVVDRTPGSSGDGVGIWLIAKGKDPARTSAIVTATQAALDQAGFLRIVAQAKTATQVQDEALAKRAASPDWTTNLITGSALVALLVGLMIIATTFTILIAQRRRQIALLRLVGASRAQVASRLLAQALLLGVLGTLVGLPLGVAVAAGLSGLVTHSLTFGLVLPWGLLAAIGAVGVLATVAAALLPTRRAMAVPPIEALQTATTPGPGAGRRRRLLVGGTLAAAVLSAAALAWALVAESLPAGVRLASGVVGASLISVGVLATAPSYVPWFIGRLDSGQRLHPIVRLSIGNVVRNPGRAGATAMALMLAVGLIITAQVGLGSGQGSAFQRVDELYPTDVSLQSAVLGPDLVNPNGGGGTPPQTDGSGMLAGFPAQALQTARDVPGVADAALVDTTEPLNVRAGTGSFDTLAVAALTPQVQRLLRRPLTLQPGEVGLPTPLLRGLRITAGAPVTLQPLIGDSIVVRVVEANLGPKVAVVTPDTLASMHLRTRPGLILARLSQPDRPETAVRQLTAALITANPGLEVSGSGQQKANLRALLDGITLVVTGLLGVAALVALVGVGNTLGLSVVERTRESALLRALGMQRSGLRWMLVTEAMLLSGLAALVGLVFGIGFGWTGAAVMTREVGLARPGLAVDGGLTASTVLVVLLSAAAASVIPARYAARANPVEALADDG